MFGLDKNDPYEKSYSERQLEDKIMFLESRILTFRKEVEKHQYIVYPELLDAYDKHFDIKTTKQGFV